MTSDDRPLPSSDDPFDEEAFSNEMVEGVGSTSVTPIPAGEYFATLGEKIPIKSFPRKDDPMPGAMANIAFHLIDDDGRIKAAIDGREPIHTETYFLDYVMGPNGKAQLDMGKGKNVKLNRLREALGQNTGAAWSINMLKGVGPVKIKLRLGPDRQDKDITRNFLSAVGKV